MKNQTFLGIVLAIPLIIAGFTPGVPASEDRGVKNAVIFFSPSCHACIEVKEKILPEIEKEFGGQVAFEYRDLSEIENYDMLASLLEKHGLPPTFTVPVVFLNGVFLQGKEAIENGLRDALRAEQGADGVSHMGAVTGIRDGSTIVKRFQEFTPAAVIGAGLVDGINPCAFTVIVFFMSFLALQGYRRRHLVAIGLGFIVAVFLTYLLIGLGLFNFLYRFKNFLYVTAALNFAIGTLSILLALFCVDDIVRFRRTGSVESMTLQLPSAVKRRIHDVIGFFYRRKNSAGAAEPEAVSRPRPVFLFGTALVTGFLVSVLEAVCTGQVYLPTIVFVMKTTALKARAMQYLALYNIMFVVPLLAVFVLAVLGAGSAQFAAFFRRHVVAVKGLLAVVFFAMGMMLLARF